jgi:beta-glucosidase
VNDFPVFPEDFVFGTATAAYQIEGAWNEDGRGESIWDRFGHTRGKTKNGENGDVACDHYHRFEEDVALMKALEQDAYRFSISWPRILPEGTGTVNEKGLDFYHRLVDALLEAGVTPWATLFHWDLPVALQDRFGGFASRDCSQCFADYAEIVVRSLGDKVENWITLNEPGMFAAEGNLIGTLAPGRRNPWVFLRTLHHQLIGHGLAYRAIKSVRPQSRVGASLAIMPIHPMTASEKDRDAARLADQLVNGLGLEPLTTGRYPEPLWRRFRLFRPAIHPGDLEIIHTPGDFLGVNNYTRERAYHKWYVPFLHAWMTGTGVAERESVRDGVQYTSMGWEVYPRSIHEALMQAKRLVGDLPIYITENGAAFADVPEGGAVHDRKRIDYLSAYFEEIHRAISEGVNLKGYFLWTLMDNFEWASGYEKRFGIVYTDFSTQRRIIKDSGYWYRDLIRARRAGELSRG